MDEFTQLDSAVEDEADIVAEENLSTQEVPEEVPIIEDAEDNQDAEQSETVVESVLQEAEADASDKITDEDEPSVEESFLSDKLDKLMESNQQLSDKIEEMNALFNARIMYTEHEEKIVDQMHKELQKYKEDMYSQLVRPILLDIIEVRDSIMRLASDFLAKPEGEQSIPNSTFSCYAYDLQDILEKNNVEIYKSKSGDDFTPIKQRITQKVPTADESLHGKVADSLSCGYSYNGRTISAEKITIYYYDNSIEKNEDSEVKENG